MVLPWGHAELEIPQVYYISSGFSLKFFFIYLLVSNTLTGMTLLPVEQVMMLYGCLWTANMTL